MPNVQVENVEVPAGKESRGARVLGDIGNRLRKHLVQPPPTKPPLPMKPAAKTNNAPPKASENTFKVPKPKSQENVKPQQLTRSNSVNLGGKKATVNKPDGNAKGTSKDTGRFQASRSQSHISLKDGILKCLNAVGGDLRKPLPATVVYEDNSGNKSKKTTETDKTDKDKVVGAKENKQENKEEEKVVGESNKEEAKPRSEIGKEENVEVKEEVKEEEQAQEVPDVPTNEVFQELKDDKTQVAIIEKGQVFSAERYEIADIDIGDEGNPMLVKEYINDICDYLFKLEKKYPIKIRYLEGSLINSKMRAVLLDWLVEVHYQFGFLPETLYMSSKTLDRYLQGRKVNRKQLQLVGVTAMYIAAKFEEVCTPTVLDFSAVSDNAFSTEEVRLMEREMLQSLEFDLAAPPAVFFLRRFSKAAGAPMLVHNMAKYIMEVTVVDYATCHLFPSEQAAASLALAMLVMDKSKSLKDTWTPTLQHHTRTTLDQIKDLLTPVVGALSRIYEEQESRKLKAVYNKYTRNRNHKVSLVPELQLSSWKDRVVNDLCSSV